MAHIDRKPLKKGGHVAVLTANFWAEPTGIGQTVAEFRRVEVRQLTRLVVETSGGNAEPVAPGLSRVGDRRHVFSKVSALEREGWSVQASQEAIVTQYLAWAGCQPDLRNTYEEAERKMRHLGVLRAVQVHA